MTQVVQGLPLRNNFFTAQKQAATPWENLYFPEQAALHAVNSVLFKRLEETLDEQTKDIIQQKQTELQTHNIAVAADVPVNELRQIMESLKPSVPAPPTAGLEEAARQAMRAEGLGVEAALNSLFQTHQEELKAHRIAMENAAKLQANSQPTNVERIVERIIERDRPQPPPPPPNDAILSACTKHMKMISKTFFSFTSSGILNKITVL